MDGIKLNIKVIPNSSRCEVVGLVEGVLKVKLDVPPVDGKANEKCIKFFSKLLGVPKTSISIVSGEKSRTKVLFIRGNAEELAGKVNLFRDLSDDA